MSKRIRVQLNWQSIQDSINDIERYKESLIYKCTILVSELQKIGIDTAIEHSGEFGAYIVFKEQIGVEQTANGAKCCISAKDAKKIIRSWKTKKGGVKTAEVSPVLMTEFGSGRYAVIDDPTGVAGQGTFPDQKHAFDPDGWWWIDANDSKNNWQHSYGHVPTYPMHQAVLDMRDKIVEVARRVFADG